MKTLRIPGFVCVALAMFALPAAAQTPDGMTPAEETICDPLADATPGLYGLCVAMCEAQDCEAEYDPETNEVVFNPNCNKSSEQLLANYYKKAGPSDPQMPCVKVACPCWTELDLDNIGDGLPRNKTSDQCILDRPGFAGLYGRSPETRVTELAYVYESQPRCIRMESTPPTNTGYKPIIADLYATCRQSIVDECTARGWR